MSRHLHAALISGLLACLTLVGPPAPALAAGPGTTLTVRLVAPTTPVAWGDQIAFTIETNRPASDGFLQLLRIVDGNRLTVATPDEEGQVLIDSRNVPLGELEFIAAANKDGLYAESLVRFVTTVPRPTTTQMETTFEDTTGSFKARVSTDLPGLVPTGSVRFTGDGIDQVRALDSGGVAWLPGLRPGAHQVRADYVCEGGFACSGVNATLTVRKLETQVNGGLSVSTVRSGNPVSAHVELAVADDRYPPSDAWTLFAESENGNGVDLAWGSYSGPLDIDLSDWASRTSGTWRLFFDYGGDANYKGLWKPAEIGTLVITEGRSVTETTFEPPVMGVPVGGKVSVEVTSETGTPSGPVSLRAENGDVIVTGTVVAGKALLTLPASVPVGVHNVWADYAGSNDHEPSSSALVPMAVLPVEIHLPDPGTVTPGGQNGTPGAVKASSAVLGKIVGKSKRPALKLAVVSGKPVTGQVEIREGDRLIRTVTLKDGRAKVALKKLGKGRHLLTVTYLGSPTVAGSARTWKVRVR